MENNFHIFQIFVRDNGEPYNFFNVWDCFIVGQRGVGVYRVFWGFFVPSISKFNTIN